MEEESLINETNCLANTLLAEIIKKETTNLKSQLISDFELNLQAQSIFVEGYCENVKSIKALRCGVIHSANAEIDSLNPGLHIDIMERNLKYTEKLLNDNIRTDCTKIISTQEVQYLKNNENFVKVMDEQFGGLLSRDSIDDENAVSEIRNFARKSDKINTDIETTTIQLNTLQSNILKNTSQQIKETTLYIN